MIIRFLATVLLSLAFLIAIVWALWVLRIAIDEWLAVDYVNEIRKAYTKWKETK